MARLMLVANPAASQFTGGDHRSILRSLTRHHLVEAVWPQSAADARTIAADAVTAGFDGVIAMGGDGIVHQIAQSLVGTDVYLAVIPAGTTNVFARQIGLPNRPTRATRILAGEVEVSAWPVLTMDSPEIGRRHAVFTAGVGLDADVVAAAETEPYRKYRFGAIHYARTALGLLWKDIRKRRPEIDLKSDRGTALVIGAMAQFHTAYTYFGRIPIRFGKKPPDPMTLLAIHRLPSRRLASLLRHAATATLTEVPELEVWEGVERFSIQSPNAAAVEMDGEVIGRAHSAHFEYRAEALWVAGPPPRSLP